MSGSFQSKRDICQNNDYLFRGGRKSSVSENNAEEHETDWNNVDEHDRNECDELNADEPSGYGNGNDGN